MDLAIITVSYNTRDLLADCLEAALAGLEVVHLGELQPNGILTRLLLVPGQGERDAANAPDTGGGDPTELSAISVGLDMRTVVVKVVALVRFEFDGDIRRGTTAAWSVVLPIAAATAQAAPPAIRPLGPRRIATVANRRPASSLATGPARLRQGNRL